eukprot:s627_g50.t2
MQAGELHILSTDFTIKSKSRIICIPDGWMLAAGAKVRFAAPDAPPVNDDHGGTARIFIADGREWWGQTEIHPDHEFKTVVFKAEIAMALLFVDGQCEGAEGTQCRDGSTCSRRGMVCDMMHHYATHLTELCRPDDQSDNVTDS